MDELTFANPEMAWLGVVALGLGLWSLAGVRQMQRRLRRLGRGPVLQRLVASWSPAGATVRAICVGLAMLLLVAAMTRPRYGLRETEVMNSGIDVVFAVDASKSMLVRDVVPSRLQGTMLEISGLLDRLAGGRVALVPFAGIPFLQCPLTTDHEVVRTYMAELRPGDMPIGGTNIGRAITLAIDVLTGDKQRAEANLRGNLVPEFKGSKHKAIVLFSDGEDHEGAALEAAKAAKDKGIRIFTVGVGSGFGDPVPIVAPDGTVTGTLKDPSGNPIFSKLNAELLEKIAETTGGRYLHYANATVVPELFAGLDGLEKAEYAETFKMLGEDRYQYPLGLALLLLLAGLLVPVRRSTPRHGARGDAPPPPVHADRQAAAGTAAGVTAVAFALLLLPASARAGTPSPPTGPEASSAESLQAHQEKEAVQRAEGAPAPGREERSQAEARRNPSWLERENPDIAEGRELLAAGKAGPALQAFEAARASRPEHAVIWYNLGLAQAMAGDHAAAATSFARSLAAMSEHDPELEADLYYATGTSQLEWGRQIERDRRLEAQSNAGGQGAGGQGAGGQGAGGQGAGGQGGPGTPGKDTPPKPGTPGGGAAADKGGQDPAEHHRLAVEALQKALLADPTRADTRRNLEIARMFAYPPCRLRDKAEEPNDQIAQAREIALDPKKKEHTLKLRACPGDADLFKVELMPGDRLTASVTIEEDTDPVVDPLLQGAGQPQLGLALLSADGEHYVRGEPPPAPPIDTVELNRVTRRETFVLAVRNAAELETPYKLDLKLMPACSRIEDAAEPNDSMAGARAAVVGKPLPLRICPLNEDWFSVELLEGQGLMAAAKVKHEVGADVFELAIVGPDGRERAQASKQDDGWLARMAGAETAGTYFVRVRGGLDTEADYQLALQILPPCDKRDDPFEDNDQALQANPMDAALTGKGIGGLHLCPGDDDWYRVELKAGESLFVDLQADVAQAPDAAPLAGALTVTVYDEQGKVWGIARGGPVPQGAKAIGRTAAVLMPPPGVYRVRVTGGGVAAPDWPLPPLPPDAAEIEREVTVGAGPGGAGGPAGRPAAPGLPPAAQPSPPPGPATPPPPGHPPPGGAPGAGRSPGPGSPGITARPLPPGAGPAAGPTAGAQGPRTIKVKKIVLPEGFPRPAVNRRLARLDLPYKLQLRIVPPCPAGNDDLEPNDEAGAAKTVQVGAERLLRLCKGDVDWLEMTQKAGQDLQVLARYDFAHGALEMEAFDESGGSSLARGKLAAPRLPGPAPAGGDDTPEARRGRTATTALGLRGDKQDRKVKLKISAAAGVANFYVLRVQEPPPPSKDKKNEQKKDKKSDRNDKKDKKKKQNKKKNKKNKKDPKEDEKKRREQLRRQMKHHDRNPKNLEAQEALRRSPFRNTRPDKDW